MSKTKRQLAGGELLEFARSAIINAKPSREQLMSFTKRLAQIMERDGTFHPEVRILAAEVIGFFEANRSYDATFNLKHLNQKADDMEKIHHRLADADYLRAVSLACKAVSTNTQSNAYDAAIAAGRACVKAYYACGRDDEIKTAIMLVF